jgi:hypothetical protein
LRFIDPFSLDPFFISPLSQVPVTFAPVANAPGSPWTDLLPDFFSIDANVGRGGDAQPNLVAFDRDDGDR